MTSEREPRRRVGPGVAVALLGAVAIALAAQVRVPMHPVPMTLQTAAVFAIALLVRPGCALLVTAIYLVAAWLGLPVLSGGASFAPAGLIASKTAGYVLGFVPAACLLSWWRPATCWRAFVGAAIGHAVVLAVGWAWLAAHIGAAAAWQHGVVPFVWGALLKSAVVAPMVRLRRETGGTRSSRS